MVDFTDSVEEEKIPLAPERLIHEGKRVGRADGFPEAIGVPELEDGRSCLLLVGGGP